MPLTWAVEGGHEGIVQMLLHRKDVNPDQPDTEYGLTPLSWAAEKGYEQVMEMLLEREDVNPDQPDTFYAQVALSQAVQTGHDSKDAFGTKGRQFRPARHILPSSLPNTLFHKDLPGGMLVQAIFRSK